MFRGLLLFLPCWGAGQGAGQQPEYEDYCAMLGEDNIQGIKHGFMAGNKVTYCLFVLPWQ